MIREAANVDFSDGREYTNIEIWSIPSTHCAKCGRFISSATVRGYLICPELGYDYKGICSIHGEVEVSWSGI
jgi:hypothetical protein